MQPNLLDGLRHSMFSAYACGEGFKLTRKECMFLADYIADAEIKQLSGKAGQLLANNGEKPCALYYTEMIESLERELSDKNDRISRLEKDLTAFKEGRFEL